MRPEIEALIAGFRNKDKKENKNEFDRLRDRLERLSSMIPRSDEIIGVSPFTCLDGPMGTMLGAAALTQRHLVLATRAGDRVIALGDIQIQKTAQLSGVQALMYVAGAGPNKVIFGLDDAGSHLVSRLEQAMNAAAFE